MKSQAAEFIPRREKGNKKQKIRNQKYRMNLNLHTRFTFLISYSIFYIKTFHPGGIE